MINWEETMPSSRSANSIHSLDLLLPFIPIGLHSWKVCYMASNFYTELMNIRPYWKMPHMVGFDFFGWLCFIAYQLLLVI